MLRSRTTTILSSIVKGTFKYYKRYIHALERYFQILQTLRLRITAVYLSITAGLSSNIHYAYILQRYFQVLY